MRSNLIGHIMFSEGQRKALRGIVLSFLVSNLVFFVSAVREREGERKEFLTSFPFRKRVLHRPRGYQRCSHPRRASA
jgi:hypothetical protein